MWTDTLTALAIYGGAMGMLVVVAYYLRWDRRD